MNKITRKQLADQIGCKKTLIHKAIAEIKQQSNVLDGHIETRGRTDYLDNTATAIITDYITRSLSSSKEDEPHKDELSFSETDTQILKDEELPENQSTTDPIIDEKSEELLIKESSSVNKTEVALAQASAEINAYKLLWETEKQNRQNDLQMFQSGLERSYEQVEQLKQQLSQQEKLFEAIQKQLDAERQHLKDQLDIERQQFKDQLDIERGQIQRLTRDKDNAVAALIIARETLSKISSASLFTNKKALAAQCLALPAPPVNN